jgi:hypothetical protein
VTFRAKSFLDEHPEFAWQKAFLRDMPAGKWTRFSSSGSTTSGGSR